MPSTSLKKSRKYLVIAVTQAIKLLCRGSHCQFYDSLKDPMQAQDLLLQKIVKNLAITEYGRQYGVQGEEDYIAFQKCFPVQTYEDIEPWITRQIETNQSILTPDRIVHVEPTSGSRGKVKRIHYTKPLLQSFSNMFRIWVYDLLSHGLTLETGRIFMSVSPLIGQEGFGDDSNYLSKPLRFLVSPFLVSPPQSNTDNFIHELALNLLNQQKLEVISIWSPSYLLTALDYILNNREKFESHLTSSQNKILLLDTVDWKELWPDLKLISCWDNALSEPLANQIRDLFPNVQVQGKGLLATEAPITVPLTGNSGCVPLVGDVFLEFETKDRKIKRLNELQKGKRYQLIITLITGITRYRLDDIVEVQGFCQNTPTLKFIGRAQHVCDMAGEKLHDDFVRQALLPLIPSGRFLLTPHELGYILLTEKGSKGLAEHAEEALCQAHHYALARRQGQIKPLEVLCVPNLLMRIQESWQKDGMKIGDIKDIALITDLAKSKNLLACCGK